MKAIRLFFLLIVCLTTNILVSQTNYIPNGGFELPTWIDGTQPQELISKSQNQVESWDIGTGISNENPNGVIPAEGSRMYYIKCLTDITYEWDMMEKPAGSIILKNGNKYEFSFKVYAIPGSATVTPTIGVRAEMKAYDWTAYVKNNPVDKQPSLEIQPNKWNSFNFPINFTASAAAEDEPIELKLTLYLLGNASGTIIYLDDFVITDANASSVLNYEDGETYVYPFVITNRCTVVNNKFEKAEVYNLTGNKVLETDISKDNKIDFSHLSIGYYLIKLSNNNAKSVYKVLKK